MKTGRLAFFLLLACSPCFAPGVSAQTAPGLGLLPKPMSAELLGGTHTLPSALTVAYGGRSELAPVVDYLKEALTRSVAGSSVATTGGTTLPAIRLRLLPVEDDALGDEGYDLVVDSLVTISANAPAGAFYGVQTLLQLLPPRVFAQAPTELELILPRVRVIDRPRYAYRGMHLDPCRHFFSVETTKRYLDYMAYHKLNKFHWHLTEDQGWRIEIKKYPKLAAVSSKRAGTIIINTEVSKQDQRYDSVPVEGYYTQEEIREVIAYATDRFIEVIPEIEMPGHAQAALAAYPDLGCPGNGPYEVWRGFGVSKEVFCAGHEGTYAFLEGVIDEVAELFPSEYIHIGGDECPKDRWESCPRCQAKIKAEGLADEHELQSYLVNRMERYINAKGKTLVGWSEIMEGGIAPNAVLQSWLGEEAGIGAAAQAHPVIVSPFRKVYFDGLQVAPELIEMEPYGQRYCWTDLANVYSLNPTPERTSDSSAQYFIGTEGAMWTEEVPTAAHLEYMLMPRIAALAEVAWTEQEQREFGAFSARLDKQYQRYEQLGVNYRLPHPLVADSLYADTVYARVGELIPIGNPTSFTEVYYTLDGTVPDSTSAIYRAPVAVRGGITIRAVAITGRGKRSSVMKTTVILGEE